MKGLVIHKVWNVFVFFPLLAAAEDNISWESVENGTKRWGTKETCQICEPRQTGYRLIPSRPWKWRKRKKKCKKRGIARAATASDAWFQTSLYISVGPTWLHSSSNHPFPQTNQTGRGRVMPSSLTLWSDARRFPAIIGSYWFTLIGTLTSLRAAWPQRSFISFEFADWLDRSSSARKK